ncbi:hypothetical protein J6590_071638 [Homalodisca vitripennis]|nr:hypothetical protein J6590_095740 [Homalodisca vitripennis]KAG8300653.1 hypothetical protein J6590_071638 [Homalodisca vitripennis]
MNGANLRYGSSSPGNPTNAKRAFVCHPGETEAMAIFVLGGLGMVANVALITIILARRRKAAQVSNSNFTIRIHSELWF